MRLSDPELEGMLLDRRRLLEDYARSLRRVGPHVGKTVRKRENATLRVKRLALRHELRANADAVAARCMTLNEDFT